MTQGYPIVLNLAAKRVLVIGSGREAEEKSRALEECGAQVTRQARSFQPGDCAGFFLVVAAGPDRAQNQQVFDEAERLGILVNCVDDPPRCRFTFASIVRRGDLLAALSTQGACPALSVRLRERLEKEWGPEYEAFLEIARQLREGLAQACPDFSERKRRWYAIVDSPALELLRAGRRDEAEQLMRRIAGTGTLS